MQYRPDDRWLADTGDNDRFSTTFPAIDGCDIYRDFHHVGNTQSLEGRNQSLRLLDAINCIYGNAVGTGAPASPACRKSIASIGVAFLSLGSSATSVSAVMNSDLSLRAMGVFVMRTEGARAPANPPPGAVRNVATGDNAGFAEARAPRRSIDRDRHSRSPDRRNHAARRPCRLRHGL